MKTCSKCGAEKPFAEFHKRKQSADGLAYHCKACAIALSEAWRQDNPDAMHHWRQENREQIRERKKQHWTENKDRLSAVHAAWARRNRPLRNAALARCRTEKFNALPSWANHDAIIGFYLEAERLTRETGIKHVVDHIVPLRAKIVNGLHWEGNLKVITQFDNQSKKNRHWPDMPC
jgi:hypothetical protein